MTKHLFSLVTLLIFCISIFAQNNLTLNIHHKLGDDDFVTDAGAKNNLDHDFKVKRLQYYISEISVLHDGGTETIIEDVWVLVNAKYPTAIELGNYNVTSVEALHFHIGVDPDHNHLDPSTYPSSHPLAPQSPSMHWGWASGYRFIAYEGYGGSNYNQLFELHGLGDNNYFKTEIPLLAEAENNEIVLNIDADYTRGLENIEVNSGVIEHSSYGAAKEAIENFRDYVFSASETTTSVIDFSEINRFEVYPNPTVNGLANIIIDGVQNLTYQVSVTDIIGKQLAFFDEVNSNTTVSLDLNQSGLYFVSLIKAGQPVITKKLVVQ